MRPLPLATLSPALPGITPPVVWRSAVVWERRLVSPHTHARATLRMMVEEELAEQQLAKPPAEMRLSELKAELDLLNVVWRGVCFEKAELVNALVNARANPPPPSAPPPPSPPPSSSPAAAGAAPATAESVAESEAAVVEAVSAMKLRDIKAELARRGVPSVGFLEKPEFVHALIAARLTSPMEKPMESSSAADDDDDVIQGETRKMDKPRAGAADGGGGGRGEGPEVCLEVGAWAASAVSEIF